MSTVVVSAFVEVLWHFASKVGGWNFEASCPHGRARTKDTERSWPREMLRRWVSGHIRLYELLVGTVVGILKVVSFEGSVSGRSLSLSLHSVC